MILPLAQEHQRTVRCDCHDPGAKAAFSAESGQMDERPNQGVLKDVLCVFVVAKDLPYPALERPTVAPAQLHECVLIPVLRCRQEIYFAGSLITGHWILALA
jgi:hypothetical protein